MAYNHANFTTQRFQDMQQRLLCLNISIASGEVHPVLPCALANQTLYTERKEPQSLIHAKLVKLDLFHKEIHYYPDRRILLITDT